MNTFFAPANAGLKLNAKLTISVFPDIDTDEAPASTVHWLFCCVPGLPIVSAAPKDPASLANWIALDAREK